LATLLAGKPLADELLSTTASVAVGTSPPVTPSSSQAHPWMRRELLVPVDQPFSTPRHPLAEIWPAISLLFFPDEPRAYV
jgi:hypothetical protein